MTFFVQTSFQIFKKEDTKVNIPRESRVETQEKEPEKESNTAITPKNCKLRYNKPLLLRIILKVIVKLRFSFFF